MFEARIAEAEAAHAAVASLAADDPIRIDSLNALAYAVRLTDGPRCYLLAEQAAELSEQRGYLKGLAYALRNQTFMGPRATEVASVVKVAERALELYTYLGDVSGQAASEDRLATLYERTGDYPSAFRHATSALAKARELGDQPRIGWCLSSLGGVHAALGEGSRALEYFRESLEIFSALEDPIGEFRLMWRMAALHREEGRPEAAYAMALECQRRAEERQDPLPRIVNALEIGRCLEALHRDREAREVLEDALNALSKEHEAWIGPDVHASLGQLLLRDGDLEEARRHLELAATTAERIGALPLAHKVRESLADLEEAAERPSEALAHIRRALELRDRLFDVETRKAIARDAIQAELEAAQKDAEIHRLRYVELERMQAQLIEAERLALLGDLAAGIAHEANSPLGVIRSNLQTLGRLEARLSGLGERIYNRKEGRALFSALQSSCSTSREAVERLQQLITSLRRFARLDEAEYQQVDLGTCLESVLELFRADLPTGIRIETHLEPAGLVGGFPGELNQAFMALLNNARHALRDRGTIRVESLRDRTESLVTISDNGPGIPEDELPSIFQSGFGPKGTQMRFRLGLSSVASIVKKHGGRVEVKSGGWGTRFEIRIPTEGLPGTVDLRAGTALT